MAKDVRNKLALRLARLEAARRSTSKRATGVVHVRMSDGQPFPDDVALNYGVPVMFAPEAGLEEWEAIAVASQRRLKAEVRT
jgi:hypothetical protein